MLGANDGNPHIDCKPHCWRHDRSIAGVAALAGALSRRVRRPSSQSDTEQADLARERKELSEILKLAEIYVKRGVDQPLARRSLSN